MHKVDSKFDAKQTVYCTKHLAYATIVKISEDNETFMCKLRSKDDNKTETITVSKAELTDEITVYLMTAKGVAQLTVNVQDKI